MALERADRTEISKYVRDTVQRMPPRGMKAVSIGRVLGAPEADTPPSNDSSDRLATTSFVQTLLAGIVSGVSTVFGRSGAVVAQTGDYTAAQVTNAADKSSGSAQSFAGGVLSTNASEGVGYATGSGGTVTQATSKSTQVTLNTATGQITMNAAALAAGASVQFTLANTVITPSDVIVAVAAAGFLTNYRVEAGLGSSTGFAFIRVTNVSGGSLSQAVQINFVVLKGATS